MTTLIACSHGTADATGRAAVRTLIDQIRGLLPGIRVEEAFVDVQDPAVDEVVDRCVGDGPVVVVPLLLSTGFHTNVDIARAVAKHPGRASAAPALGPHELLADVLHDRLTAAGVRPGDAVVLAAAGSSDPAAAFDVQQMAAMLARRLDCPVTIGFAAGAGIRIADAVRAAGSGAGSDGARRRVAIASYVLAPGHFARVIARGGGDLVTLPLAPDPRIAEIAAERCLAALRTLEPAVI